MLVTTSHKHKHCRVKMVRHSLAKTLDEVRYAWTNSHKSCRNGESAGFDRERIGALQNQPSGVPTLHPRNLFPQKARFAMLKLIAQNRSSMLRVVSRSDLTL
jgi:hypothetical protein